MKSQHYLERIEGRLAKLSNQLKFEQVYRLHKNIARIESLNFPSTESYGIKVLSLSSSAVGRSNGNEVWVIIRQGILQTIMLRKDTQGTGMLNVDNIVRLWKN
jgi:hypothetical protein